MRKKLPTLEWKKKDIIYSLITASFGIPVILAMLLAKTDMITLICFTALFSFFLLIALCIYLTFQYWEYDEKGIYERRYYTKKTLYFILWDDIDRIESRYLDNGSGNYGRMQECYVFFSKTKKEKDHDYLSNDKDSAFRIIATDILWDVIHEYYDGHIIDKIDPEIRKNL